MLCSSPIPRGRQAGFHESSYLRSIRDTDSTSRQWIKNRTGGINQVGTDNGIRFLSQRINMQRRRILGGGATSSSGMTFKGEWSPSESYDTQNVVVFTNPGGSAGMYIALQSVSAGTSPDTGAPAWFAFPNSPPSVFA